MGADNGSFPSGIVVLAAGSDWKSTAGPRPVRGRSAGTTRPAPPRPEGAGDWEHTVDRRAGGPRQQQGGAQRIYRRDTSDPPAWQRPRPCGGGSRGHSYLETQSSRLSGATWWRETRGCFCLNQQECGVSFRRQRDTEGSGWQPSAVSEAATKTPLMLVGAPQHTRAALDTGSQTVGAGDTDAGFLLLRLHTPEPASPMPFHHPTLPSGGDKGERVEREVGVPRSSLGEVGEEQEGGHRTRGEKPFACCPSPMFFSPDDFVALGCCSKTGVAWSSFKLPFLLTTWRHSPAPN